LSIKREKEKVMKYVYRWWAEFEEFGEKVRTEKYFSSHEKMKLYSADYEASNDWDASYVSGYDKYKVD
jgi:hypothetical protein